MSETRGIHKAWLGLLVGAVEGTATAPAQACDDVDRRASEISATRYEAAVLCLINRARAGAGRGALRSDARLSRAASRHTRSMVKGNFFSHSGRGGSGPADRIRAAGYIRGASRWRVGENIAWGARGRSTPRRLVSGWKSSSAHRRILLGGFRDVGIGVVMGSPSRGRVGSPVTITADFGRRRG